MVAGCSATCVKYLFFTFNFLVFVCGGVILGLAIWARFDNDFVQNVATLIDKSSKIDAPEIDKMYIALYIIAGVGAFLLICGFLGCCGACCENTCLLGMFFAIIFILFLVEIAGGIYIFFKREKIRDDIDKILQGLYENASVKEGLEQMEDKLHCCGRQGCQNASLIPVTDKCCAKNPAAKSCTDLIFDNMKEHFTIVAIVAIVLLIIEILAMVFSCCLWTAIRNSAYSYY